MELRHETKLILCEYIRICDVPNMRRCWDYPERCTIYQRRKVLERGKKHLGDRGMFIGS